MLRRYRRFRRRLRPYRRIGMISRYKNRYRKKYKIRRQKRVSRISRKYRTFVLKSTTSFDVGLGSEKSQIFNDSPDSYVQWADIKLSFEDFKICWVKKKFIPKQNQSFNHSPSSGTAPKGFDDNQGVPIAAAVIHEDFDPGQLTYDRVSSMENAIRTVSTSTFSLFKRPVYSLLNAIQPGAVSTTAPYQIAIPNPWFRTNPNIDTANNTPLIQLGVVTIGKVNTDRVSDGNRIGYVVENTMKVMCRNYKNNALK